MKFIQLSEHSEPKPYILKANYPLETKATYFKSKDNLIDSPQTQLLSYCVANGYLQITERTHSHGTLQKRQIRSR